MNTESRTATADEREAKLPQWAQTSMMVLRRQITDLEREMALARGQAPANGATGKIIADCLGSEGFPLNDRALIKFHLPGGKVSVMLRENGTRLDLNTTMGTLCIHPQACNSAHVTVVR